MFPIRIKMSAAALTELAACAEGSYSDAQTSVYAGEPAERSLQYHAHVVAKRHKTVLEIRNHMEAEDMYYEVCSGVFQIKGWVGWDRANAIADALRPVVKEYHPGTVQGWPAPYDTSGKHLKGLGKNV